MPDVETTTKYFAAADRDGRPIPNARPYGCGIGTDLYWCKVCGAVAHDAVKHIEWHEDLIAWIKGANHNFSTIRDMFTRFGRKRK